MISMSTFFVQAMTIYLYKIIIYYNYIDLFTFQPKKSKELLGIP